MGRTWSSQFFGEKLVGHSAGGGFVLRIAGEAEGRLFSRFVLLSPVLGRLAPTTRPDAGWAKPNIGTILLLKALNYAVAFNGLAHPVTVKLAPGVNHMGVVSDPRSVPLIVGAVAAGNAE